MTETDAPETDAPVRKTVKPAHAGALIPDPAHRNDLPQDGAEVVWDHYWIGRLTRGEITLVEPEAAPVTDVGEGPAAEPVPPEAAAGA